jgi:hypothetical protein
METKGKQQMAEQHLDEGLDCKDWYFCQKAI